MNLLAVHKVMIATAIVACVLFAAWAAWMSASRGSLAHVALSAVALVAALGLGAYLRYFIRRSRRLARAERRVI
jgi:hypothetical protein